ncbi:hypothetical protein XENOCAPTIV_020340 [Xenoophorus captivus]|uniref:Uncharacterized protein n=1 Tax=Xenoophorus captivus TaxID=1517983 RepID=A0ABV0SGM1_9TELE
MLSKCCFVKAALPWILELLTTHFKYSRGSVNDGYDKPESFETVYRGSPIEALQRVSEVLSIYWELVTTSDSPVDWRCQQEYSDSVSSMTELPAESTTQYFTGVKLKPLECCVMNNADVWEECEHRSCEHFHRQL